MPVELDHVFVWVSEGGREAERLAALGLTEGPPNRHRGQGTACRRFFFANAYLELLWVESPEEARGELARPLRLWERWSGRGVGACPFGVVLRPARPGGPAIPFPAQPYRPAYLPPTVTLHAGVNADCVEEPLLIYSPVPGRPGSLPTASRHVLEHEVGFRQLTALRILGCRAATHSPMMQAAEQTDAVVFHPGPEHVAELGFDGERRGRRADLRPALPLVICW